MVNKCLFYLQKQQEKKSSSYYYADVLPILEELPNDEIDGAIIQEFIAKIEERNIVYISRFSEQAENLSMTLFENDSKLYESKSLTGGSFGKTLDIKNLPFGDYKLVINYGDNRSLETTIKK